MLKISCIIPTCGRPALLTEALNSVLNQTVQPFEIILVDNGKNKVFLPAEISDKVIIKRTEPLIGAARARNLGAKAAQGDFLAFLDDDDCWNPRYLERVIPVIKNGAQCIYGRLDLRQGEKIMPFKNPLDKINLKNLLISNPGVGGPNIVIEKRLFDEIGGYDETLAVSEDKSLAIEMLKRGVRIEVLPENEVVVRSTQQGLSSDHEKLAEGISRFTCKYRLLMNKKEFIFNWYKIVYHRYKSGRKIYFFPFVFLKMFFIIFPVNIKN